MSRGTLAPDPYLAKVLDVKNVTTFTHFEYDPQKLQIFSFNLRYNMPVYLFGPLKLSKIVSRRSTNYVSTKNHAKIQYRIDNSDGFIKLMPVNEPDMRNSVS